MSRYVCPRCGMVRDVALGAGVLELVGGAS